MGLMEEVTPWELEDHLPEDERTVDVDGYGVEVSNLGLKGANANASADAKPREVTTIMYYLQ